MKSEEPKTEDPWKQTDTIVQRRTAHTPKTQTQITYSHNCFHSLARLMHFCPSVNESWPANVKPGKPLSTLDAKFHDERCHHCFKRLQLNKIMTLYILNGVEPTRFQTLPRFRNKSELLTRNTQPCRGGDLTEPQRRTQSISHDSPLHPKAKLQMFYVILDSVPTDVGCLCCWETFIHPRIGSPRGKQPIRVNQPIRSPPLRSEIRQKSWQV